jgi:predicted SnoaL-like aldol condensation-catalyzing enzyme
MIPKNNERVIRDLLEAVFTYNDFSTVDQIFVRHYAEHVYRGISDATQLFTLLRKIFPVMHFVVAPADDDKVVVRWTAFVTPESGPRTIFAPDGYAMKTGIDIYRLENGKVVEHLGSSDVELPEALYRSGIPASNQPSLANYRMHYSPSVRLEPATSSTRSAP